jgi:hypothetical protein
MHRSVIVFSLDARRTFSYPAVARGWMVPRSDERFILCPGKSGCVVHLTVMGRVFTTSVTVSPWKL